MSGRGFKKCVNDLGVACTLLVPGLQRQRQAGLWEFSVSLVFTVRVQQQVDPVSKQQ